MRMYKQKIIGSECIKLVSIGRYLCVLQVELMYNLPKGEKKLGKILK